MTTSPAARSDVFLEPAALRINAARQEHLASLGLDIRKKRVLEVGAGIGLHTKFFEERECDIVSTDANAANLAEILRRHPHRAIGTLDLDRQADWSQLGSFDLVYCYGTLYHLADPNGALRRMAQVCTGQILLETIVALGEYSECQRYRDPRSANQAIGGIGCRPTRRWVMETLGRLMGYAYTTVTQPDYPDFIQDWRLVDPMLNYRAIFVGSRIALDLPTLTQTLPDQHAKAGGTGRPKPAFSASRVWIDVGAYKGGATLSLARSDPGIVVYAFEPLPQAFEQIQDVAPNYVAYPLAIAEKEEIIPLHVNRVPEATSLLRMDDEMLLVWRTDRRLVQERDIFTQTVRLDRFMSDAGISAVELLNLDASGAELQALASAGDQLSNIKKIVVKTAAISRSLYVGGPNKETIIRFLTERGFTFVSSSPEPNGQEERLTFQNREGHASI